MPPSFSNHILPTEQKHIFINFHDSNLRGNYRLVSKVIPLRIWLLSLLTAKKELCSFLIIRESLLTNLVRFQKSTKTKFLKNN